MRKEQSDRFRDKGSETIEIVEETLDVQKAERPLERATVRIVPMERDQRVDVVLAEEHVEIERVEVNRPVDAPPPIREEHGVLIIPVLEEALVVEKRLVLREEIHVRKRREERHEERTVTLRSEEAHVEREDLSSSVHQETATKE